MWTIYHSPGFLDGQEKRDLASRIADHYEAVGLPRFYVVTVFRETSPEDMYVGGEPSSAAVRISVDHIARHASDAESRRRNAEWIKGMIAPTLNNYPDVHWEFHADETSEQLWMINGLFPPPGGSTAEETWAKDGFPSAYS
ncbi:tautomerase family protein [Gryllotalpicola protaetiae]|nr:tautomerase family protein [Gryllotalpicola protaetiae]